MDYSIKHICTAMAHKKIITNAWAVTITLYSWSSPAKYASPGEDNSIRIKTEKAVPIEPAMAPNIMYNVPISLWLVLKSHLSDQFMAFLTDKDIRIFCCCFCQNKTKQQNAKTKNMFLFFFLLALGAMTCHCLHSVVLCSLEQRIFCCCFNKNNNKIISEYDKKTNVCFLLLFLSSFN